MNTLVKAKLEAVSTGPFVPPPRLVPIITLAQSKRFHRYWWLPVGVLTLIAGLGIGASLWREHYGQWTLPDVSMFLPDVEAMMSGPDPEANTPYAETMYPPPSDVVIPIPIVS